MIAGTSMRLAVEITVSNYLFSLANEEEQMMERWARVCGMEWLETYFKALRHVCIGDARTKRICGSSTGPRFQETCIFTICHQT